MNVGLEVHSGQLLYCALEEFPSRQVFFPHKGTINNVLTDPELKMTLICLQRFDGTVDQY